MGWHLFSFRKWYLLLITLFAVSNLLLFFWLQPFIYRLCGYSPRLIGKLSAEAFEAYHHTVKARLFFFKYLIAINCLVLLFSVVSIRFNGGKTWSFSILLLVLSSLLLLLFAFVIRMRGLDGLEILGSAFFQ